MTASDDPEALRRQIAELQALLARTQATPAAQRVDGGVHIGQGDFVAGHKFVVAADSAGAGTLQARLQRYLQALGRDLATLRLGDIDAEADVQRQQPLDLADVYVPLDTTLHVPVSISLAQWLGRLAGHQSRGVILEKETRRVPVTAALAHHQALTLLGAPGSGKSSVGARMLLALALARLGHANAVQALGPEWTHGTPLPVRVVLRRFAERLPPGDAPARAGQLWDFIATEAADAGWADAGQFGRDLRQAEAEGGLFVLFDGLDECGTEAQRHRVRAAVDEFVAACPAHNRVLLTVRPYAGPDKPDPLKGEYTLAPLDEAQVQAFIERWYRALAGSRWLARPADAQRKQHDLQAAARRDDLGEIASNPLLLTLMALLHTHRGHLPDDRADMYAESVNLLLQRWTQAKGSDAALADAVGQPLRFDQLRQAMERLAFEVHEASADRSTQPQANDIGEDRLVRSLAPLLGGSRDKAALVVDFVERRAGLLLGLGQRHGERQFSFPHRSFQEFMAAGHLATRERFAAECRRLADADAGHWQVVLTLAARLAGSERGTLAADNLVGGSSVADAATPPCRAEWDRALLAGLMLQEIGPTAVQGSAAGAATVRRVAGWLAASLPTHPAQGGAPAPQRAYAGRVLAALGDPRFDAALWHLPADPWLGFVEVPAEPAYALGTRREDEPSLWTTVDGEVNSDEINNTPVPVPRFWIGRHMVTVAQFNAFLQASGASVHDSRALKDGPQMPVRWVTWHEALAYCRWLNTQLASHPSLADLPVAQCARAAGLLALLPSELEWERAARGPRAHAVFPWGDAPDPERANYLITGVGTPTVVGCFAPNALGLHDIVGNLWEWTRSTYRFYPYVAADGREALDSAETGERVVRGGGYYYSRRDTRCARRSRLPARNRGSGIGFRVVLVAPQARLACG